MKSKLISIYDLAVFLVVFFFIVVVPDTHKIRPLYPEYQNCFGNSIVGCYDFSGLLYRRMRIVFSLNAFTFMCSSLIQPRELF